MTSGFIEHITESANYAKVLKFIGDKMENTEMDIDDIRAAAIKKFGSSAAKQIEKAIDEISLF